MTINSNKEIERLIKIATSGKDTKRPRTTDSDVAFGQFLQDLKITTGTIYVKSIYVVQAYEKWRKKNDAIVVTPRKIGLTMKSLFPHTKRCGYPHYMLNRDLKAYAKEEEK